MHPWLSVNHTARTPYRKSSGVGYSRMGKTPVDELLAVVTAKTGLPADKAKGAVEAVLEYLKEKLPGPLASQLDQVLETNAGAIGDAVGDAVEGVKDRLGGIFGGDS